MNDYCRKEFHERLSRNWIPVLEADGFVTSGWSWRRDREPFIHCISVQDRSDGKACCVNLGAHLTFLPVVGSSISIEALTPDCCEIKGRLAPSGQIDHWWPFDGGKDEVENLIGFYESQGRAFFEQYDDFPRTFEGIRPEHIENENLSGLFPTMTKVRIALLLARVNEHLGNIVAVRAFADLGLRIAKHGVVSKREFKRMLGRIS